MKDFMHCKVKKNPVIANIVFDKSAHKFSNAYPAIIVLTMSKPPRKAMSPKSTTMCIKSFFLLTNFIDKYEKIKIGIPMKAGMYEVKDLLPLKKLISIPQIIKNNP